MTVGRLFSMVVGNVMRMVMDHAAVAMSLAAQGFVEDAPRHHFEATQRLAG